MELIIFIAGFQYIQLDISFLKIYLVALSRTCKLFFYYSLMSASYAGARSLSLFLSHVRTWAYTYVEPVISFFLLSPAVWGNSSCY